LEDQYKLEDVDAPKYIVDAGANIGLTSALLLERFPDCSVLSIEPDPQNYSIASQNLKGYGDRCRLLRVALWSKEETLSVQRGTYRDGLDWASQTVSTNDPNSATVSARTLNSLLSEVGFPRIDLLKIDIEGAELQVFGEGDTSFLEKTSYCATECHDDQCLKAFVDATKRYGFSIRHEGELAIAWHPSGQPRRDHS
jgi:FkbM family methyltransferase